MLLALFFSEPASAYRTVYLIFTGLYAVLTVCAFVCSKGIKRHTEALIAISTILYFFVMLVGYATREMDQKRLKTGQLVIKLADEAMYKAKQTGKDRACSAETLLEDASF